MIEERVIVCSPADNLPKHSEAGVWVEGIQQSACKACSAKSACGSHSLSKLGRTVKLWLPTNEPLKVGEEIMVGLAEGALAKSAMIMYGLPLVGLMLMAIIGDAVAASWISSDALAAIMGFMGLVLGFVLARIWSDKNQSQWQPKFLYKCQISFTAID